MSNLDTPEFVSAWSDFLGHLTHTSGREPSIFQAEELLRTLSAAGVEKAIRDLRLSIKVGARSLCDSDSRRNGAGTAPPANGTRIHPKQARKLAV